MNNNLTYPAIIEEIDNNFINVTFPSFENAMTYISKKDNIVSEAQDYLVLLVMDYESTGRDLPWDDNFKDIHLEKGQKLVYINVWMPYHRTTVKEVFVKKTLTIPVWIDELAKANNINFSSTLVEALKIKLHLIK